VSIHDKHIELIVRQMLRRVLVAEPGDAPFLPGERVGQPALRRGQPRARAGRKARRGRAPRLMGHHQGVTRYGLLAVGGFLPGNHPGAHRGCRSRASPTSCSASRRTSSSASSSRRHRHDALPQRGGGDTDAERMSSGPRTLEVGDAGEANTDNLASWLRDVGRSAFATPYEPEDPYVTAGSAYASFGPTDDLVVAEEDPAQ